MTIKELTSLGYTPHCAPTTDESAELLHIRGGTSESCARMFAANVRSSVISLFPGK